MRQGSAWVGGAWLGFNLSLILCSVQAADLLQQEGSIGADFGELDLRNDQHRLQGNVRIQQGDLSIEAEEALASALQTEDSRWTFERSVHLQTAEVDLKSNTATAEFAKGGLAEAKATGTPATFEQRSVSQDKQARGRAGEIQYDVVKGVVTLTNDVWFTYGGNEFRGNVVVYNVREERVLVNPQGKDSGRVNITIRPRNGVKLPAPRPRTTEPESGS
jgi:lipopolysaccharide transport protein LptA